MKFRLSRARGKYRLMLASASGAPRSVQFELRKSELSDPVLTGFPHTPEHDFHLTEFSKGYYARLTESGIYDVFFDRSEITALSPVYVPDNADFIHGIEVYQSVGWFGDGSDGTYTLDGTQGTVSGLFTRDSGTQYTLLRDACFDTLTINVGITLKVAGYRLFVKNTLTLNGDIDDSGSPGNNGGNGANGTSGVNGTRGTGATAQTGLADVYLARNVTSGNVGGAGGNGGGGTPNVAAAAGTVGNALTNSIGSASVAGVSGGQSGNCFVLGALPNQPGGAGGAAGTVTALAAANGTPRFNIHFVLNRVFGLSSVQVFRGMGNTGGSGGGGGTDQRSGAGIGHGGGGGGASAGTPGGTILVIANTIAGNGSMRALGGNGGVGGNGGDGYNGGTGSQGGVGGGGGGGGSGGSGGLIMLIYHALDAGITFNVAGGTGGAGGSGGVSYKAGVVQEAGAPGNTGNSGNTGIVIKFNL